MGCKKGVTNERIDHDGLLVFCSGRGQALSSREPKKTVAENSSGVCLIFFLIYGIS